MPPLPRHWKLRRLAERSRSGLRGISGIGSVGIDQATQEESSQQTDLELTEILSRIRLADPRDDVADATNQLRILKELLALLNDTRICVRPSLLTV